MQIDDIRDYCLAKPGSTEDFPFDEHTLAFKVMGKMFALVNLLKWEEGNMFINLKCDPNYALKLRDQFPEDITGAYHMSKKHWNSVFINRSVSPQKITHLINHSYELVVSKLNKKQKLELSQL